jgi:hypothetical protein
MGGKSFFTFDTNYPYYALAPSAAAPGLWFKQVYKLAPIGQKHILTYVADSANIATLKTQVATNAAAITALGKPRSLSAIPSHPVVEATGAQLGPADGKFFMVSLDSKAAYSGANYYAEMQLGTSKPAGKRYSGANSPMNFTYERLKESGSLDAAATQLMSLSTQKYRTQVVLADCAAASPPAPTTCAFENS